MARHDAPEPTIKGLQKTFTRSPSLRPQPQPRVVRAAPDWIPRRIEQQQRRAHHSGVPDFPGSSHPFHPQHQGPMGCWQWMAPGKVVFLGDSTPAQQAPAPAVQYLVYAAGPVLQIVVRLHRVVWKYRSQLARSVTAT